MTPPPKGAGQRPPAGGPQLPGRRRRAQRRTRRRRKHGAALVAVGLAVALVGTLAAVGLGGVAAFRSSCSLSALRPVAIGQNSFVYAADGSLLGAIPAERNRQPVSASRISRWMPRATVAIEDRRFYEHGGVDYEGIARALWRDLKAGKVIEGGSTITQQLVRNLYISRERTLKRKVKEACLAIKLSRHWSKLRILTAYMNQVYYGNHAYGVEAAAQTYFSRHAHGLTLAQAALLAGLPQAPSVYDPFVRPSAAVTRRNEVLRAMLETGSITQAQYAYASGSSLRLKPGRLYTRIREPYFFSYVRNELIAEYGASTVASGGLSVYTTIDPRFQRMAAQAIRETLNLRTDPAAALVSINPGNGAIRAMATVIPGSAGNQFNLVAQARRQPGSTFKTFVLAAAIEQGINPASTYYVSAPFRYQPDPQTPAWEVQTYDHTYVGWTSIERATLRSDNTVYAQLTLDVGPENVAAMARKLGVRTLTAADEVPAIGLGAIAISPLDEASAYATLAAGGIYSRPMAIRKVILANGKEDTDAGWGRPERKRVIPDGVAAEVTRILEENIRYGTGVGAAIDRPAAGKTGTTDNHADAWFSGYTPNLEATVWVGYPRGEIPMESVHGIAVAGGTFPATIWKLFMEPALGSSPAFDWVPAQNPPVWIPFKRGQYALQYAPQPATTESTTTGAATTGQTTAAAPGAPAPTAPQSGPPLVPLPQGRGDGR